MGAWSWGEVVGGVGSVQSTCIYGNMEKLGRCIFACGSSSAG